MGSNHQSMCGSRRRDRRAGAGFTLIELLVVIVIIGVLAAITLNVAAGARARAATDRARSELAVITVGLEEYRRVFGAYPQGEGGDVLLSALAGKNTPTGAIVDRRAFVSFAGLTLRDEDATVAGNLLLDPWEHPYAYLSFTNGSRHGYRLYSTGPDGEDFPPTPNGTLDEDAPANLDNIHAHR